MTDYLTAELRGEMREDVSGFFAAGDHADPLGHAQSLLDHAAKADELIHELADAGRCYWRLSGGCQQEPAPDWKWCEWCNVLARVERVTKGATDE